jgi:hypothetical protein
MRRVAGVLALASLLIVCVFVGEAQPRPATAPEEALVLLREGGTAWVSARGEGYVIVARRRDPVLAFEGGLWAWRTTTTRRAAWRSGALSAPLTRDGESVLARASLERVDLPSMPRRMHDSRFEMGCLLHERVDLSALQHGRLRYVVTRERRCDRSPLSRVVQAHELVVDAAPSHGREGYLHAFVRDIEARGGAVLGWSRASTDGKTRARLLEAFISR